MNSFICLEFEFNFAVKKQIEILNCFMIASLWLKNYESSNNQLWIQSEWNQNLNLNKLQLENIVIQACIFESNFNSSTTIEAKLTLEIACFMTNFSYKPISILK